MKYFIDTNIFLRVIINEDAKAHKECKNILQSIKSSSIDAITSGIVLAEMVWVLEKNYGEPKKKVVKLIKHTININGLKIVNNHDMSKAMEFYGNYNIKFIDAMIASIPAICNKDWTVVSYDEDFKKLPVLWIKPGSLF